MQHFAVSGLPDSNYSPGNRAFTISPHFYRVTFFLYLILSCFYIFPSGNPQPADFFMVAMMVPAFIVILFQETVRISLPAFAGLLFVGLTMVINPIHYLFTPDKKFLLSSLYYLYNFAVYIFVAYIFKTYGETLRKPAYWAVVIVILVQLLAVVFFPDAKIRQTGTLNNPNQLSYWSLLSLMMLIALKGNTKLNVQDFLLMGILMFIQTVALSKAGLIASFLTLSVLPFMPQFSNLGRFVCFTIMIFAFSYLLVHPHIIESIPRQFENVENTVKRLEDIGQDADDSIAGRGYTRIIEFPEYLLLGAGEGAEERFDPYRPIEIHSGVATIIFSYGIFGAFLFSIFLYSTVRNRPLYCLAFVFFVILYGLTHQNFRFTHFWILLGMLNGLHFKKQTYSNFFSDKQSLTSRW